jgi:DNA-binding IclR family transcriptional regulator
MESQAHTLTPYLKDRLMILYYASVDAGSLSVADAARVLGLRKSAYVASLLDRMVAMGWAERVLVPARYQHFRYYPRSS